MSVAQITANSMKIFLAAVIFLRNILQSSRSLQFQVRMVKNVPMIALKITSSKVKMADSKSGPPHNATRAE